MAGCVRCIGCCLGYFVWGVGVHLYSQEIENVVLSVCAILIMLGFVTKKNITDSVVAEKQDLIEELNKEKKIKDDEDVDKLI